MFALSRSLFMYMSLFCILQRGVSLYVFRDVIVLEINWFGQSLYQKTWFENLLSMLL